MKKKILKILVIVAATLALLGGSANAFAEEKLKVFIIEINPHLQRIKGTPKVSEYFGQNLDAAKNELIEDLEYTSHGFFDVEVVDYQYLDEFPTYKSQVILSDGRRSNRLDENTYLKSSNYREGSTYGDWYALISSEAFRGVASYSFDYDYIIEKYDLIKKRNDGVFDQVWFLTIDPAATYETIMVGKNPFWINAPAYIADCPNFQIVNVSISRRDANLHALSHGFEGILNAVFRKSYTEQYSYNNRGKYKYYEASYNSYSLNSININQENYKSLNYWEMYTLGTRSNLADIGSVGNVHFPFNAESDYEYTSTKKVYTNWKEWADYPNITGKFELDNNEAWLKNAGNDKLGYGENKDPDRLYTRFWLYMMPHIDGLTSDGYLNNWWKYYKSLDFVADIDSEESLKRLNVGDALKLKYTLLYNSGVEEIVEDSNVDLNNIQIDGDSIKKENGKLVATRAGESTVTVFHDGTSYDFKIDVAEAVPPVTGEVEEKVEDSNTVLVIVIVAGAVMLVAVVIVVVVIVKKKKNKNVISF